MNILLSSDNRSKSSLRLHKPRPPHRRQLARWDHARQGWTFALARLATRNRHGRPGNLNIIVHSHINIKPVLHLTNVSIRLCFRQMIVRCGRWFAVGTKQMSWMWQGVNANQCTLSDVGKFKKIKGKSEVWTNGNVCCLWQNQQFTVSLIC